MNKNIMKILGTIICFLGLILSASDRGSLWASVVIILGLSLVYKSFKDNNEKY